jgi:hypothetical protein
MVDLTGEPGVGWLPWVSRSMGIRAANRLVAGTGALRAGSQCSR